MKLFCIPYAGGMSNIYYPWKHKVNNCEIMPIILKGREKRVNEGFYKNVDEAAIDIKEQIISQLNDHEDFAIFGHSMGALLAYEVYYKLADENKFPKIIFLSARRTPSLILKPEAKISGLPFKEIKQKLLEHGGMSENFFEIPELIRLFMPVIRADYKIMEEYHFVQHEKKVGCKVVILGGNQDDISQTELIRWNDLLEYKSSIHMVDGNHFFVVNRMSEVLKVINEELNSL